MSRHSTIRSSCGRTPRLAIGCAALLLALLDGCGRVEPPAPPAPPAKPLPTGNVTAERVQTADQEPGNWYTGGRDAGRTHHSPLAGIDANNVGTLGVAWDYATGTTRGMEATPIVVDGVMYTSGVAGRTYALDAATGQATWR